MKYDTPLEVGIIEKRYKRFLSDIYIGDELITAHTPNTGSMKECWEKGWEVAISRSNNPKRKLPYTLELTNNGKTWIMVNTSRTNAIVKEALENNHIKELEGFSEIKPEAKVGKSRLDFLLTYPDGSKAYLEVKNVTFLKESNAQFPDSVSERGRKHLEELIQLKENGHRAIMVFVISRGDVSSFSPCDELDPEYGKKLREAFAKGVEIYPYMTKLTLKEAKLSHLIPLKL